MNDAVIVDAVRTPIGRAHKGSLAGLRGDDLAAAALAALVERNPEVDFGLTEDILLGCAVGAGEQGYNVARNAALLAEIPERVPAATVQRFCASSLQAVRNVFHAIRAGEGAQYVAAGSEAVSRMPSQPWYSRNPRLDGSARSVTDVYIPMGLTAENVAEREGVGRPEQDEWAVVSHRRAVEAQRLGHFDAEIVPVDVEGNKVTKDDGPRADTSLEALGALEPAFRDGGTVTAGNSCPLNDGAAAALIVSRQRAEELGLKPRARIVASSVAGVSPAMMGLGPVPAVESVLRQARMTIDDIDVVELNEAFAAQVIACVRRLSIDLDRLNPSGGAIALGHPFGMTGVRILATLLNEMERADVSVGLETMCVAGGMGQAVIIERV